MGRLFFPEVLPAVHLIRDDTESAPGFLYAGNHYGIPVCIVLEAVNERHVLVGPGG